MEGNTGAWASSLSCMVSHMHVVLVSVFCRLFSILTVWASELILSSSSSQSSLWSLFLTLRILPEPKSPASSGCFDKFIRVKLTHWIKSDRGESSGAAGLLSNSTVWIWVLHLLSLASVRPRLHLRQRGGWVYSVALSNIRPSGGWNVQTDHGGPEEGRSRAQLSVGLLICPLHCFSPERHSLFSFWPLNPREASLCSTLSSYRNKTTEKWSQTYSRHLKVKGWFIFPQTVLYHTQSSCRLNHHNKSSEEKTEEEKKATTKSAFQQEISNHRASHFGVYFVNVELSLTSLWVASCWNIERWRAARKTQPTGSWCGLFWPANCPHLYLFKKSIPFSTG